MLTPKHYEWDKKARKALRKLSDTKLIMRYIWERDAFAGEPRQGPFWVLVLEEMYRRSH